MNHQITEENIGYRVIVSDGGETASAIVIDESKESVESRVDEIIAQHDLGEKVQS
jgi:hypothetical protein